MAAVFWLFLSVILNVSYETFKIMDLRLNYLKNASELLKKIDNNAI